MIKVKDLDSLSAFLMRYAGEPLLPLQVSEVHVIEKLTRSVQQITFVCNFVHKTVKGVA